MSDLIRPDATVSEIKITSMLTNEKDSLLFKQVNAALLHLAALEEAKEIEFFLQAMEKITERKLEEEAATYASYYDNKKREELNWLIDEDNRKQQEQIHQAETHTSTENHFTQLIFTVLTYHLTQLEQAEHQVVAAQAAQLAIQKERQAQRKKFVIDVVDGLTTLGIAPTQIAQVQNQLQIGTGLLPLQNIQKLNLKDITEAYEQEVKDQIVKARNERDENGAPLSDKQVEIFAQQRAANKMNFVPRDIAQKKIMLVDTIRKDLELMEAKRKEHPHLRTFKLAEFVADFVFPLLAYQNELQDLQDRDIVEKVNEKFSQEKCEQHKSTVDAFIEASQKIIKEPHIREQISKLKFNKSNADAEHVIRQCLRRG